MADLQEQIDTGRRMDHDFSREDYRFRAKIITSEYAEKCINLINAASLSQACKNALIGIVMSTFDPNSMLARNVNTSVRKIQLEIQLIVSITAYDESDGANPELLNIVEAIRVSFSDIVSRSLGGKERDQIGKSESVSTQNYSGLQQPQEQKRGLQILGRNQ